MQIFILFNGCDSVMLHQLNIVILHPTIMMVSFGNVSQPRSLLMTSSNGGGSSLSRTRIM